MLRGLYGLSYEANFSECIGGRKRAALYAEGAVRHITLAGTSILV
jgi:hypothetical protein